MVNDGQQELISRTRIYIDGEFAVDLDTLGRYHFLAPDCTAEKGLDAVGVMSLHRAVETAWQHAQEVIHGKGGS